MQAEPDITKDFLTCYSCSYYSSMVSINNCSVIYLFKMCEKCLWKTLVKEHLLSLTGK